MPTIFISHAATDQEIANRFKVDIERSFLGLCNCFVSSNLDSLNAGVEWMGVIKDRLQDCAIFIGLTSPIALQRPWIYFEFGSVWMRGIPVIPVCHTGLERGGLVPPISTFHAINLTDSSHLEHLYKKISDTIGCNLPNVNFENLSKDYLFITETKRLSDLLIGWTRQLFTWNPEMSLLFDGTKDSVEALVPGHLEVPFMEFLQTANSKSYLNVTPHGFAMGTRIGAQANIYLISRGAKFIEFKEIIERPNV